MVPSTSQNLCDEVLVPMTRDKPAATWGSAMPIRLTTN